MWQISIRISLCLGYLGLLLLTCNAYTIISLPLTARQINTNFTPPYILQYQKNISQTSPISQEIIQPGIPTVVERLYFGILGGNGYKPVYIAADNQRHRIYTLNTSLFSEGNTISVLNTKTGNFVALLKLNNKPDNSGPPPVQDLQIDSYRPQLYALWGGNGLDWSGSNLTIIDTETLTVTKTISDVAVIAAAPDRLYLANNTHLWAIETNSFKKLADQDLEPHQGRGALLINAQANRLYLWKSDPALVEVFEADSLTLIHHYSIKGKLAGAIIDEDNQRLLVVTNDKNKNFLRALDMDGYPLSKPTPVPLLGNNSANFDFRMVIDKHTLYIVEGEDKSYYLRALALPNLIPATDLSLSLTFYPYDLTFDTNTGYFYGTQYDTNLILEIDSITGDTRSIPTYSTVTDALADPTTNQLYVLNQWGTLWVLGLTDGKEVARLETGVQADWIYYGGDALSLDPNQSRLYVDGNQFGIVDTRSLTLTMSLSLPGQATFDPTRNRTYLTSKDCGTQILNTETGEELAILFPYGAKEPPQIMGPCIYYNKLASGLPVLACSILFTV